MNETDEIIVEITRSKYLDKINFRIAVLTKMYQSAKSAKSAGNIAKIKRPADFAYYFRQNYFCRPPCGQAVR